MKEEFRSKCKYLEERYKEIHRLLSQLHQNIIVQDLSKELNTPLTIGRHSNIDFDKIKEIIIDEGGLTLINKQTDSYYSYVVYTKKEFHTIGLGFMYKGKVVAPHMDFCVEDLIRKYNNDELLEIEALMEEELTHMNDDIAFLTSNTDVNVYAHYYGEYNKGFDSNSRFETISDVINNFKSLSDK